MDFPGPRCLTCWSFRVKADLDRAGILNEEGDGVTGRGVGCDGVCEDRFTGTATSARLNLLKKLMKDEKQPTRGGASSIVV